MSGCTTCSAFRYFPSTNCGRQVFVYQLHTGPLTTRNAIRILELYDYPPELIAEAYAVQERLLKKPE